MRRLVVFLMFLLKETMRTTRMLPTKPMRMMMLKRMGTRTGTTFSSLLSSASSPSKGKGSSSSSWSRLLLQRCHRIFAKF